jgi:formyltetrahydrofolate deformylase
MPRVIARLLISCPDGPGIVAAVSSFLAGRGANILSSDQYTTDPSGGRFFMRMEFALAEGDSGEALERDFGTQVAERFAMEWRAAYVEQRKRVAILVSREEHCLLDLLWRSRRGELDGDIGLVISNHEVAAADVAGFGVPFEHVPVTKETKPQAEQRMLELLAGNFDLVVLARYMQILSGDFLARVGAPVINIHHSFLPAFVGAEPYRQARERGVKIIGATAHYVTEELDAGPIIEQDVVRVSHRDDVRTLASVGGDVERTVLRRAVDAHLQDRTIVHAGTTVVF